MKISRRNYRLKIAISCCMISMTILMILLIVTIRRYNRLIQVSPLTSKAFWEYNQTSSDDQSIPLPIITIDQVNLTNLTLIITACCRNVEKDLVRFQNNILPIGNLFGNYKIYLGESDSQDGTLNFLQQWALNDSKHVDVYTGGNQRWKLYLRTRRIAHCRNHLLQRARADIGQFDYYLAVDVDKVSSPKFTVNNFLSNFIYPSSTWAVMTASQTDFYYDLWALRASPTMSVDFIAYSRQASLISIAWQSNMDKFFSIHNKGIPRDHSLIQVESAFGGAALYNGKYLNEECVYNGWMDQGFWFFRQQCEHISFNECIRRRAGDGKIFINPMFETTPVREIRHKNLHI